MCYLTTQHINRNTADLLTFIKKNAYFIIYWIASYFNILLHLHLNLPLSYFNLTTATTILSEWHPYSTYNTAARSDRSVHRWHPPVHWRTEWRQPSLRHKRQVRTSTSTSTSVCDVSNAYALRLLSKKCVLRLLYRLWPLCLVRTYALLVSMLQSYTSISLLHLTLFLYLLHRHTHCFSLSAFVFFSHLPLSHPLCPPPLSHTHTFYSSPSLSFSLYLTPSFSFSNLFTEQILTPFHQWEESPQQFKTEISSQTQQRDNWPN